MTDSRRRPRPWVLVLGVLALIVLVTAWQAWTVRSALLDARDDLRAMAEHLDERDKEAAVAAATRADEATSRADWHSHTPVWWASQYLPFLGDDVGAVRAVSAAAHDLTEGVVSPLVEAGLTPDQFRPTDGRIPIEPLRRARALLEDAAPRVADVEETTRGLETAGLLGSVREPVEELQSVLSDGARISRAALVATQVLPSMLGGDGDRTYLVAFQNNAEVRATGGMPGSLVELTARDGRLKMRRTLTPDDIASKRPVATMTKQEQMLFPPRTVRSGRPTFIPDFPRVGELFNAFWEASGRPPLDGVLSMDPVALAGLLEYTGAGHAAGRYQAHPRQHRRRHAARLLSEARRHRAGRVLRRCCPHDLRHPHPGRGLRQRTGRPRSASGIDERRIAVWSAHPEEQRLLAGRGRRRRAAAGHRTPRDRRLPTTALKGDKLSYYLHSDVTVTPEFCDGRRAAAHRRGGGPRSDVPGADLPRPMSTGHSL